MLSNNYQQVSQEDLICQERIRQAKLAFNISVIFVAASAGLVLVGVVLLTIGYMPLGTYATIGGLTSTAVGSGCVKLSSEANDRLDRLTHEFNDDVKIE
jgi:hypothetical protein